MKCVRGSAWTTVSGQRKAWPQALGGGMVAVHERRGTDGVGHGSQINPAQSRWAVAPRFSQALPRSSAHSPVRAFQLLSQCWLQGWWISTVAQMTPGWPGTVLLVSVQAGDSKSGVPPAPSSTHQSVLRAAQTSPAIWLFSVARTSCHWPPGAEGRCQQDNNWAGKATACSKAQTLVKLWARQGRTQRSLFPQRSASSLLAGEAREAA